MKVSHFKVGWRHFKNQWNLVGGFINIQEKKKVKPVRRFRSEVILCDATCDEVM